MLKIEINVKDGKSTLEITGSSTNKDILSAIKTLDVAKKTFKDSLKEGAIESFSKILGKENAERLITDERVEKAIDNCLKKSKFEKMMVRREKGMVRIEIKIENGELGKTVEMRGSSKEVLISLLALEDVTKEIKNSMKEELFVEAENNE